MCVCVCVCACVCACACVYIYAPTCYTGKAVKSSCLTDTWDASLTVWQQPYQTKAPKTTPKATTVKESATLLHALQHCVSTLLKTLCCRQVKSSCIHNLRIFLLFFKQKTIITSFPTKEEIQKDTKKSFSCCADTGSGLCHGV